MESESVAWSGSATLMQKSTSETDYPDPLTQEVGHPLLG
jgi:hypothetical protein